MSYVITNGSKFISMNSQNRVDTTRDIYSAKFFDSILKANNFMACIPKALRSAGYEVVDDQLFLEEASEQPETACEQQQTKNPIKRETVEINEEYLDLDYLYANVQVFEEFIHDFQEQKDALIAEQRRMEGRIIDLEHAAELCELDVRRGYLLYKMLHDARKRRRACKDALLVWGELEQHIDRSIMRGNNTKTVNGLYHREYTPREIDNLFEIFDGKAKTSKEEDTI